MLKQIQNGVRENQAYIAQQCQILAERRKYEAARHGGGTYWPWVIEF